MIVGEAPGKTEDETGRPFVGRAGKLLTESMRQINIEREKLYITNMVKCRPPANRQPRLEEIKACAPYLAQQIILVKPKAILLLGRTAAAYLVGNQLPSIRGQPKSKLEELRGKIHSIKVYDRVFRGVATYHPAAILRNPRLKKEFLKDLLAFKMLISGSSSS